MDVSVGLRHRRIPSPDIDVMMPSPTNVKSCYQRQNSETDLSPSDTPRKNKRKLSEPKRRTTDFSIKRLCPDSPGSACSESGRSEESTPERPADDSLDVSDNGSPMGLCVDKDLLHANSRPPFMFPDLRHHPYFIPQFYYNRFPGGFPGSEHIPPGFHGYSQGLQTAPGAHQIDAIRQNISSKSNSESVKVKSENSNSHVSRGRTENRVTTDTLDSNPTASREDGNESSDSGKDTKKCRKNYKNMTRERRVEANARERSRVHTISAAFDGLRRAVPSYSYNQKLSKLAILRIACSYISALSKLTEDDDDGSSPVAEVSFAECVDNCTRTIQTEGKARRRH